MRGESWLYIDSAIAHLWDYFADPAAALTNTELLFVGAARPYANFFLPHVTYIALAGQESLPKNSSAKKAALEKFHAEAGRATSASTIAIIASDLALTDITLPAGVKTFAVDSRELLTNIEPAWRALRLKLNKDVFDTVLVAMGPARVFVIPRLAQVYDARVIDVTAFARPLPPSKPHILRRLHGKIKQMIKSS
jgi:hypothetical protein